MTVSFAIQTHPARAEMAETLQGCLGGRADVVVDPMPESSRSAWRTYRRALERAMVGQPDGTTHRLIVQDDVAVCDHFVGAAEAAAAARPDRVLVFFVAGHPLEHSREVRLAYGRGQAWAELDCRRWCPVVATAWPLALIPRLLAYVDAQSWPPSFTADDEIVGRYLSHAAVRPLATVPSLVEHPDTVPSIMSGRHRHTNGLDPTRRAVLFVEDTDVDVRAIDWTLGAGAPSVDPAC